MLITKTPLRVSLFGGGTDYPDYCDRSGGLVLGGTIDKYIYISAIPLFAHTVEKIRLSYRETESVKSIEHIQHPIVREYLKKINFDEKYAFHTVSDIPGGTGLGSSSAFSVGFIKLIQKIIGNEPNAEWLAREAIDLERNLLHEPVGLQDQYHAAFGGFSLYKFKKNRSVSIQNIPNLEGLNNVISKNAVMIYTGNIRAARGILPEQVSNTKSMSKDHYLQRMKDICFSANELFNTNMQDNFLSTFGELLKESWELKLNLASTISNSAINEIIDNLYQFGANGAKVLGAGGGGFVFAIGDQDLKNKSIEFFGKDRVIDFRFTSSGSKLMRLP